VFRAVLDEWRAEGLVAPWVGRTAVLDPSVPLENTNGSVAAAIASTVEAGNPATGLPGAAGITTKALLADHAELVEVVCGELGSVSKADCSNGCVETGTARLDGSISIPALAFGLPFPADGSAACSGRMAAPALVQNVAQGQSEQAVGRGAGLYGIPKASCGAAASPISPEFYVGIPSMASLISSYVSSQVSDLLTSYG
jgi:hypothetical protein